MHNNPERTYKTPGSSGYLAASQNHQPGDPMSETLTTAAPLSVLSEEEQLFRQTVREFAETEVKPHVMAMDEAAKFNPDLIARFFELGLMGIEVPETDRKSVV